LSWKRKRNYKGKTLYYSMSSKLRREGKSNEDFEIMLASLPLEDIIALKLELAGKPVNGRLYGLELWKSIAYVARDAVIKFAVSASRSKKEAQRFLGVSQLQFNKLMTKYETMSFFVINEEEGP